MQYVNIEIYTAFLFSRHKRPCLLSKQNRDYERTPSSPSLADAYEYQDQRSFSPEFDVTDAYESRDQRKSSSNQEQLIHSSASMIVDKDFDFQFNPGFLLKSPPASPCFPTKPLSNPFNTLAKSPADTTANIYLNAINTECLEAVSAVSASASDERAGSYRGYKYTLMSSMQGN